MGFRENERGLKQVSHEKLFKKLFLRISQLDESWKFSRVASELQKFLDEFVTRVSRLASREVSREKLWHLFFNIEHI